MAARDNDTMLALWLAPIGGSLVAAMTVGIVGVLAGLGAASWMFVLVSVLFGTPVVFLDTWLIGGPWHVLMQRRSITSSIAYWGRGAIAGALIVPIVLLVFGVLNHGRPIGLGDLPADYVPPPPPTPLEDAFGFAIAAVVGAMPGAATGLIFWLIVRPDRDDANPTTPTP